LYFDLFLLEQLIKTYLKGRILLVAARNHQSFPFGSLQKLTACSITQSNTKSHIVSTQRSIHLCHQGVGYDGNSIQQL